MRADDASPSSAVVADKTGDAAEADHARALQVAKHEIEGGNYDRAIEVLNLAVQGWPNDQQARYLLARASMLKAAKEGAPASAPVKPAGQPNPASPVIQRSPTAQTPPPAAPLVTNPAVSNLVANGSLRPAPDIKPSKPRYHEVSASGDFFMGQGKVTMPFGFGLVKFASSFGGITPTVASPKRDSDYFGGTVSYSYKRAWAVDFAFAHGDSSGNANINIASPSIPSHFSISDDWLQLYVRYTFPGLRFSKYNAYLRAGGSIVQAELHDTLVAPGIGLYTESDKTQDFLGNLGAGLAYALYTGERWRIALQGEAEAFFGTRSQKTTEDVPDEELGTKPSASLSNTLYGGIGRVTVRAQYAFGKSGFFKAYGEAGFQGKFTEVDYSSAGNFKGGSFDELLWGPYVKLGVRYSF